MIFICGILSSSRNSTVLVSCQLFHQCIPCALKRVPERVLLTTCWQQNWAQWCHCAAGIQSLVEIWADPNSFSVFLYCIDYLVAGTGKRIRYRGHKWKRIRKKIQSTRKCIHLVSGRMCVGNRRSESYDSLRFSESAQSRGHTAAKEVVGHIKDESEQAFSCLRYLRLFFFLTCVGRWETKLF